MRARRPALLTTLLLALGLPTACGSGEEVGQPSTMEGCPPLTLDSSLTVPDPPDGAAQCASGSCNYQTQDGCDDSEACRPQFNATDPDVSPGCEAAGEGEA